MAVGHDRRVIGIVAQRREHAHDREPRRLDEGADAIGRRQHVIRREADLARVEGLAVHDARGGDAEVGRAADDHRALAAQLEGQRHQILRRGAHDVAPDRRGAGEDQVIEGEAGKCLTDVRPARHDGDLLGVECLGDHALEELRRFGRRFRGLDHCAIARSQHAGERGEREIDGKVPRADHAHDALGLVADLGLRAQQAGDQWRGRPPLAPHPARNVGARMLEGSDRRGDVAERRCSSRPRAEIGIERRLDRLTVVDQKGDAAVQPVGANRGRRAAVPELRRLLPRQDPVQLGGDGDGGWAGRHRLLLASVRPAGEQFEGLAAQ